MKRLVLFIIGLAMLVPAGATARTSVSGGLKQTIVQSFTETNHLDVSTHQISGCFSAYTYGRYALVGGGANYRRHEDWYRIGGFCDIKAVYNGQLEPWQPDEGILRHENGSGGYWRLLVQFDEAEARQLTSHGVPISVYENLVNAKPYAAAQTGQCAGPPIGVGIGNDKGAQVYGIKRRDTSCQSADRAIQRGRLTSEGFTTPGYACRVLRTYAEGGAVTRCTHASMAFRFTWAT